MGKVRAHHPFLAKLQGVLDCLILVRNVSLSQLVAHVSQGPVAVHNVSPTLLPQTSFSQEFLSQVNVKSKNSFCTPVHGAQIQQTRLHNMTR